MSEQFQHKTSNLYESAYLLARGFKLLGKEKNGAKTALVFCGEGIDKAVLKFYSGGLVKARLYSEAYKKLKDYIFSTQ